MAVQDIQNTVSLCGGEDRIVFNDHDEQFWGGTSHGEQKLVMVALMRRELSLETQPIDCRIKTETARGIAIRYQRIIIW